MDIKSVCMIGTLVPEELFQRIQRKSKVKAAASPVFMQEMIRKSLIRNGITVESYGYPPVATFPRSFYFGSIGKSFNSKSGCIHVIPLINIHILKEISVFLGMFFSLLRWNLRNRKINRAIIVYADFLEYAWPALFWGKIFHVKTTMFMTEMPGAEHYSNAAVTFKEKLLIKYERIKSHFHNRFDGYVFVSEKLEKKINEAHRPFTVVEGFYDEQLFTTIEISEKEKVPTLMYAGSLGPAYNIEMMVDAFSDIEGNYQLWIFGNGRSACYVKKAAEKDKRIRYYGVKDRRTILEAEKKATLLAHLKSDLDSHSQYSFSSKILEYMASGTPMLTSIVGGVPSEYYEHSFVIDNLNEKNLSTQIRKYLDYPTDELLRMGESALTFVRDYKSLEVQGKKIIDMLERVCQ